MSREVYRRSAQLLEADVGDDLYALEPDLGLCFGFNEVAKAVWRKLEHPRTFEELHAELLTEYDVSSAECTSDLRELLAEMRRAKLIELGAD